MDEESNKKLVGDFSQYDSFLPGIIKNRSSLTIIKEKANKVTWENEGEKLLEKDLFNDSDKALAKLLLLKGGGQNKRGDLWFISTGAKKKMIDNPNYYTFLFKSYPKEIELPNEKQIDLDINRTFPEDPMFHTTDTKKKLRNILLCYSKRNLTIGYVQGFNFIVGRLLKYIPEEEKAFWVFCQIIESILPLNFYSSMSGLIADIDILLGLFKEMYMPEFNELMKEAHFIYLKNVLLQWFLSIFVINFPSEASLTIWDVLFIDRNIVLFKIAIYLIKGLKGQLLEIKDIEHFKDCIRNYFESFNDIEYIKYVLLLRKFEFDEKFIEYNRAVFLKPIIENINRNSEDKIKKLKEKNKERKDYCDPTWPFCIYDCDSYYQISDFIIFRQAQVDIINDYYVKGIHENDLISPLKGNKDTDLVSNASCSTLSLRPELDQINYETAIIERKHHVCCKSNQKRKEKEIVRQKTSDSEASLCNSETEKSNEEEEEYHFKKAQYKNKRTNGKCISTISFMKTHKKNYICPMNNTSNSNKKENNKDDFNCFISKLNYHYQLCSVAKEVALIKKDNYAKQEIDQLSLKI